MIIVRELFKSYGDVRAVNGVSFTVHEGEIFGLLGPNGAGKTSIIEMIEGMRSVDSGTIQVDGVDVVRDPRLVRRIIGVQLQHAVFFDRLQLWEILDMFADLYETHIDSLAVLNSVGLIQKARSYVNQLSGGQMRRFSIAVALVNRPKVTFLDEPSTGLDPAARHQLWELVRDLRARGIAVVLTTHYIEEAEELCDRVAIMDAGRIVALDTPSNLIQQLLGTGFHNEVQVLPANLEDVFLSMVGRRLTVVE